ncbi:MAG: hypothetical protein LBP76_09610 [Treponema sp.]|jgi:hypothetical protein|nr:hypothetical protein [Treponema sp.]
MKTNYYIKSPKCCATCNNRIRNSYYELFCHEDKGALDTRHLVSELGICLEYEESLKTGYMEIKNATE